MGEQVSRRSRRGDAQTLQTRRIKIPTKISLTLGKDTKVSIKQSTLSRRR
ncbi:MAG: hypothetical protein F6K58_05460 [Symploca sp. SIO2E9]|nr:hypothetical protein [Symploca sp. SIO2E9]